VIDLILHWCENCGVEENLTSQDGYEQGWDFPPKTGQLGVISPRTCGRCYIDSTAWFELQRGTSLKDLSQKHKATIKRIQEEK
jgi:hypothetical protein